MIDDICPSCKKPRPSVAAVRVTTAFPQPSRNGISRSRSLARFVDDQDEINIFIEGIFRNGK